MKGWVSPWGRERAWKREERWLFPSNVFSSEFKGRKIQSKELQKTPQIHLRKILPFLVAFLQKQLSPGRQL